MNTIVKGEKAGQGSSRKAVIAPDSAQSKTYIKILYGTSEGEIVGPANGYRSIYLDDTPLQDESGNWNFQDITVETRNGTNDQTYIEGFPDISSETAVGVELKSGTPWVRSFTNLDLDAIRVRLEWAALRTTNQSNGDVTGVTINYAIDVQTDGQGYVEYAQYTISDKTSANYQRSHRIDLPKADQGWQIRVRRITPNSTSEYVSDKMYIAAVTEVIDLKLRYPNTALIGLQYDAEHFSNVAKMAADCKGIIIKVPSNYDPESRAYSGMWDGTFKLAYTNNPAWIYYDICTKSRYALGNRLTSLMIDKWSLYRLGQYCDEMVSDGQGGLEPRFALNVYIQSAEDAYTILSKTAGVFRAMSYWTGNEVFCDADAPQDTWFTYTSANIIGLFEYTGTRARDRHNVAKVAWDNPQNRYKTEYEFVRDEAAIAKSGSVNILEIEAWGCTSRGQAQRAGLWALKSEQLETRQVSFKVGLEGHIPVPGKVIEIADPLLAGRANGGRVSAISADQTIITLDRDGVVANPGDRLVINGEDGKAQSRVVESINNREVTVTQAFENIAAQNVWVIDAADLATMKFRVVSVKQDDKHQFTISGVQYNSAKYEAIDTGAYVDNVPISIINPKTQAPVASVTITTEDRVDQGINVATMIIAFPQAESATKYLVEWRKDDGSWIKLPITGNNSIEVPGIYAGNYQARVTAFSAFDIASLPTYSDLTALIGKTGTPPKLASITATGILFGMVVDWAFPAVGALDTAYTEIEVSPDGESNIAQLGLFAYPTNTTTIQGLQGNLRQFYRGRLIDRIGNVGEWSDWISGVTSADASAVLDLLTDQITSSQLDQDLRTSILDGAAAGATANQAKQAADEALAAAIASQADANNALSTANQAMSDASEAIGKAEDLEDGLTQEIANREDLQGSYEAYKISNDNAVATIRNTTYTKLETDNIVAVSVSGMNAEINDISSSLNDFKQVQAGVDAAQNTRLDTAESSIANNSASITNIQSTYARKDEVGSIAQTALQATWKADAQEISNSLASNVATTYQTKADANTTTASLTNQLNSKANQADLNNTNASLINNYYTRTQTDEAISGSISQYSATISVGGRNMITNSDYTANPMPISHNGSGYSQYIIGASSEYLNKQIDTEAIVSLTVWYTELSGFNPYEPFDSFVLGSTSPTADAWDIRVYLTTPNVSITRIGDMYKLTGSAWFPVGSIIFRNTPRFILEGAKGCTVQRIKVELGNKATDWSAAPEDIATASALQATASALQATSARVDVIDGQVTSQASALTQLTSQVNTLPIGGGNLLKNSDFSSKGTDYWSWSGTVPADVFIANDLNWDYALKTAGGSRALVSHATSNNGYMDITSNSIPVEPTKMYQLGAYMAAHRTTGSRIFCFWQNAEGVDIGNTHDAAPSTAILYSGEITAGSSLTAYKQLYYNVTAPQGAAYMRFVARHGAGNDSYMWLTRTQVNEISTLTAAKLGWEESAQGNTAAVKALLETTNGLSAKATLQVEAGNTVGGIALGNNQGVVDFIVRANKFAIAPPVSAGAGNTGKYAFTYKSTSQTLPNGTVIPAGLYLDQAVIDRIDANKINATSLSAISANLGSVIVKNANIENGAVTTAKIGALQVDTLQIADWAVTAPLTMTTTQNVVETNRGVRYTDTSPRIAVSLTGSGFKAGQLVMVFVQTDINVALTRYESDGERPVQNDPVVNVNVNGVYGASIGTQESFPYDVYSGSGDYVIRTYIFSVLCRTKYLGSLMIPAYADNNGNVKVDIIPTWEGSLPNTLNHTYNHVKTTVFFQGVKK